MSNDQNESPLYYICWHYKDGRDNFKKHTGTEPSLKVVAESWVDAMDERFPEIKHWIEKKD